MKKLFLSFAVIAGLSMISCGNKAENAAEAEETDTIEVVEATEEAPIENDSLAAATDSIAPAEEATAE
jgi:hypothetical protein